MKRWMLSWLTALVCSALFVMVVINIASGMWALTALWLISDYNAYYFAFLVGIAMVAFHRWVFKGKK